MIQSKPRPDKAGSDLLAVRALFAHLGFQGLTAERQIPKNAGRTVQIYTYNLAPFTASVAATGSDVGGTVSDTAPPTATEGTVGTPITPTEASIQATLGRIKLAQLKSGYIG